MSDALTRLELQASKVAAQAADTGSHGFTKTRPIPPLATWNPENCGGMDLVIRANGEWFHEGSRMTRKKLVDLFSSVLWVEEEAGEKRYFLKTPVEKVQIEVEDAPLLVTQFNQVTQGSKRYLEFVTSHGDAVVADDQHPVFMRSFEGELRPYVLVRDGLEALIHRNVFFHLIQAGELKETASGDTELHLVSGDSKFSLKASLD